MRKKQKTPMIKLGDHLYIGNEKVIVISLSKGSIMAKVKWEDGIIEWAEVVLLSPVPWGNCTYVH